MTTNKQMADCLRQAKKHLWDGKDEDSPKAYIWGICSAVDKTRANPKTKAAIWEIISERLEGKLTLTAWLRSRGISLRVETYMGYTGREKTDYPAIQAHRKAWMNKLIKEFEDADK